MSMITGTITNAIVTTYTGPHREERPRPSRGRVSKDGPG
jgi:hypothetical protein